MIIDGRAIAAQILARTKERAGKLAHPPKVVAIVGEETPATKSYLKIKAARATDAGCAFETRPFGSDFMDADAVIFQLPLPEGSNQRDTLDTIPVEKDADVLSSSAREKFERGDTSALLPPVVAAVKEIFNEIELDPSGEKAVVIGDGWLVGKPCAVWLRGQGAVVETLTSGSDLSALKDADIIVAGAGVPGLVKPEHIKHGAVLIDAGTSESSGKLAGDIDPACADIAGLYTPVPGGVGPIAVACLFENAVTLAERAASSILPS